MFGLELLRPSVHPSAPCLFATVAQNPTKSTYNLAHHACPSSCCRYLACLYSCSHPPHRSRYRKHLRSRRRRSPAQQTPPLALPNQLRQGQVLPVHVSNHPHPLSSTRTHPSCSDTLDQYLRADSVTHVAVEAVGLATVRSYVTTAVRRFSQSPFRRSNPPPARHFLTPPRLLLCPSRPQLRPMLPEDQRGHQPCRRSQQRPHCRTGPWLVAQGEPWQHQRFARWHWRDYP